MHLILEKNNLFPSFPWLFCLLSSQVFSYVVCCCRVAGPTVAPISLPIESINLDIFSQVSATYWRLVGRHYLVAWRLYCEQPKIYFLSFAFCSHSWLVGKRKQHWWRAEWKCTWTFPSESNYCLIYDIFMNCFDVSKCCKCKCISYITIIIN